MAKRGSAVKKSVNKNLRETSHKKVTTSKKTSSHTKNDKEFDDIDSLAVLKDTKERTKLKGIDDKIKLLKTELMTLMGKTETKGDLDEFKIKNNLVENPFVEKLEDSRTDSKCTANGKDLKELNMFKTKIFKPNYSSTPFKLHKWADKTKHEKVQSKSLVNESQINLQISSSNMPSVNPTTSCSAVLSQQEVEQLLYKSFLKQHSDYVSGSGVSCLEQDTPARRSKQQRCQKPESHAAGAKGQLKKFSGRRKRGRSNIKSVIQSNVEVINLDSTSNVDCIDLDITELDWNEPFDLEDNSDIQIIENSGSTNDCNHKKLRSSSPEQNKTASLDDSTLPKKVWECPVCFERSKGQEIVATQCGHVFCRVCLERHISKVNSNCPSCRCDIKNKPFITLFNM